MVPVTLQITSVDSVMAGNGDFLDADALVAVPAECKHSLIGTVVEFVRGGGGPVTKLRFNFIGEEVIHD